MRRGGRRDGVRVAVPGEEGAEAEVLDDGEFGEDFGVVHFEHALGAFGASAQMMRRVMQDEIFNRKDDCFRKG